MRDCRKPLTVYLERLYGIRSRTLYENLDNFITMYFKIHYELYHENI